MAMKAATASRAPNGTKSLVLAFFTAAGEIPEARRGDVIKAALGAIRDRLKDDAAQAKIAKAATKPVRKSPKVAAPSAPKPTARRTAKTLAAVAAKAPTVPKTRKPRKTAVKSAPAANEADTTN